MEAIPETIETDERLVARFQSGDESAFDALVLRHRHGLYRLVYRLTDRHEDADDLSQEAFLRAHRALHRFRGDCQFRTWLVRIVVNLVNSSRGAHSRREIPLDQAVGLGSAGSEGPEAVLRHQVRRMVGALPRRQRQVLMLRIYEEMTFNEIATAAGMAVGTAKATFFQAVQGLRGMLARAPGTEGVEEVGT